ncbi:hypothetical protein [Lacticaseibacillus jixiensis]|uniref:hypothetical protein n=1 Tax=Lacticaseibacillus jixiensis TaxID=3231926 RepID=UPI0036F381F8
MDKAKEVFNKYRYAVYGVAVLLVVVIGFGIWRGLARTDALKDAELKFSGYNGDGTAYLTSASAQNATKAILVGVMTGDNVDKTAIDYVKETDAAELNYDKIGQLSGSTTLMSQVNETLGDIKIDVTPNTGLKNGETVKAKLAISDAEAKKYKLSNKSHSFKVSGLKKTQNIGIADIKKHLDVTFSGYDEHGMITITSKQYANDLRFKVADNGQLKNGSEVSLTVPTSFTKQFKTKGKIWQGTRSFKVKVSGLQSLGKVTNKADVTRFIDELAAKQWETTGDFADYSARKALKTYIFTYNPIEGYSFESQDANTQNVGETVDVLSASDSSDTERYSGDDQGVTIATLYQLTEKDGGKQRYALAGYSDLHLNKGAVDIATKDDNDSAYQLKFEDEKSLTSIQQQCQSNGQVLD